MTGLKNELIEVDVGPITLTPMGTEPLRKSAKTDRRFQTVYETHKKISQLRMSRILLSSRKFRSKAFGPLNTDQFEGAFVDRIVMEDGSADVKKFNAIIFLRNIDPE